MVWPLAALMVAGTLPGVLLGGVVRVSWLPDPTDFKLFAALVLAWVAVRLLLDLGRRRRGPGQTVARDRSPAEQPTAFVRAAAQAKPRRAVKVTELRWAHVAYEFCAEPHRVPTWPVVGWSLGVGVVSGVYGIGGGALVAPFLVAVLRLPVHTVAGPALLGTLVTSSAGVLCHQALASWYPEISVAPDWALGTLFGLGGACGMYVGARLQQYVPARAIKWMLVAILAVTVGKYLGSFLAAYG